jgi:hypothetical protein
VRVIWRCILHTAIRLNIIPAPKLAFLHMDISTVLYTFYILLWKPRAWVNAAVTTLITPTLLHVKRSIRIQRGYMLSACYNPDSSISYPIR